jgi:hypothetical protein
MYKTKIPVLSKKERAEIDAIVQKKMAQKEFQKEARELLRGQREMDSIHPQVIGIRAYLSLINQERYSK